ncbi:hypothetical protein [Vibrio campbellii]|uniref:hypothetical protein n=1 Tax=Vibrio campbellii TaxID=680 RepID=UPI0021096916|nr:hypothetical protein [Vibrio campbellii]UTZ44684.1 hypothetical protein HB764_25835 [Vibrio campbellii]
MKKKIMKKFADLAAKFDDVNSLMKGIKTFKNKNLHVMVKLCGRLEALRKTCCSSLPQSLTIGNKYNYLY